MIGAAPLPLVTPLDAVGSPRIPRDGIGDPLVAPRVGVVMAIPRPRVGVIRPPRDPRTGETPRLGEPRIMGRTPLVFGGVGIGEGLGAILLGAGTGARLWTFDCGAGDILTCPDILHH